MISHRRVAAGAVTLMLCGQYLAAEAIAAGAWTAPYSYSRNFISDLGVTACVGTGPCSPLGVVMNAGFILSGLLAIAATGLLLPLLARGAARLAMMTLATLHGVGSIIVGIVHSAPGTPAGTPHLHVLGAYGAILGGNLALMLAGIASSSRWAARWFRLGSLAIGLSGLGCGVALVASRGWPPGLLERGAVDTITAWEVATGVILAIQMTRGTQEAAHAADP